MLSVYAALLCAVAPPPVSPHQDLWNRSSVRIAHAVPTAPGWITTQYGSGTVIAVPEARRAWVLTCSHVCTSSQGAGTLTITTCDERVHPARVVARDALADLAVLEVELKAGTADRIQAVPLAGTEGYTPGSVVVKMGFPAGHRLHRAVGDVLPVINNPVGRADVVFTVAAAHARSGDSGGGLFRVSDGALVGVVWGGLPPKDPSFGLRASRLPEIHQLVKRAGVPLPPP